MPLSLSSSLDKYKDQKVLIVGGLGFMGTHLAQLLMQAGAKVTVVDNFLPDHGANAFHLKELGSGLDFHCSDIRNPEAMNALVKGQAFVFSIAAQTSHSDSMKLPFLDLDINCKGNLVLLEACRQNNPEAEIVYVGTRAFYGAPTQLPVNESAAIAPLDIYSVNRYAAEQYFLLYHRHYGLKTCSLRVGNIYGPYAQMAHPKYNVFNYFLRLALDNETITIYGKGEQKRDYLYVKDAVQALALAPLYAQTRGQAYNIGSGISLSFLELVQSLVAEAGSGGYSLVDWPKGAQNFDAGDFVMDISKAAQEMDWKPQFSLSDGIQETLAFYRAHHAHYWESVILN